MVKITLDTGILNSIQNYQDKMVPYICRNTLNRGIRQCYAFLKKDIPTRFPGRGGMGWMMRGLDIKPATTSQLLAAVYFDMPQTNIFFIHETGGIKTPHGPRMRFAIPIAPELRKPGKRIPDYLRPKWLLGTDQKGVNVRSEFSMRMARRSYSQPVRTPKAVKMFGAGSVQQAGFVLKTGANKLFIVTRPSKGVLKFWYYLAPMAHIQDLLKFRETAAQIFGRNIQANFNTSVAEINHAFEQRAAAEAVKGSQMGGKETATAYE